MLALGYENDAEWSSAKVAPGRQSRPAPIIGEQAGTITVVSTVVGLPEKLSITGGPTLLRDAAP